MSVVISANSLSKAYPVYSSVWKHFAFALTGWKKMTARSSHRALDDVSFSVSRGECIGVIGRNGAGKSTLLQLLTGIIQATRGELLVKGKVAALLELGAGFNPDFTGRENARLNAALLGISAEELNARIEEIIAFADIGKFIDTPVKTYSSGMYVRVAFAVQVCLSPDILIVDEALAVGDAAFQMRCFRRIEQLRASGTTILFVSHDVQAVRMICQRALWLEGGRLRADGPVGEVTAAYMRSLFEAEEESSSTPLQGDSGSEATLSAPAMLENHWVDLSQNVQRWGSGEIALLGLSLETDRMEVQGMFPHGSNFKLRVVAQLCQELPEGGDPSIAFCIRHKKGLDVMIDTSFQHGIDFRAAKKGQGFSVTFEFANVLAPDDYELILAVEDRQNEPVTYFDFIEGAYLFKVVSDTKIFGLVKPPVVANGHLIS